MKQRSIAIYLALFFNQGWTLITGGVYKVFAEITLAFTIPPSLCGMYFLSKQPDDSDDRLILDKYQRPVTLARQVINNPWIRPSLAPGETLTGFKRGSGEGRPSFSNCFASPFPQYPSQPLWRVLEKAWAGGRGEGGWGRESTVKAVFISKGVIHSLPVLVTHILFSY